MALSLSPRQTSFRQKIDEFARDVVSQAAAELDRTARCPRDMIDRFADQGLLGACIPTEYGGAGEDYVAYVAGLEAISRAWASAGAILSVHNSLVCEPILRFGDEAQKTKFLPVLSREKALGCYAFTEPAAGSDAGSIQTRAIADRDSFVLDGQKLFVINAAQARIAIVYALTDPSRGRDGLSTFIVETTSPGISIGTSDDKLGLLAAESASLSFQDCRIPKENLLGGLNRGFEIARAVVESARIDVAAQAVGIAQACLDESVTHAKARQQFGRPIAEFEAIQWMLADMATDIDAARLLMYRAASRRMRNPLDGGGDLTIQAAMAKLFASEAANRAAYNAVQIFGGRGYLKNFPVERYFRDARAMTLYEETSEIERLVIERELEKHV